MLLIYIRSKIKLVQYQIYKKAIELGYQYIERKNQYIACHTCFSEGYVVDTDAKCHYMRECSRG